MELEGEGAVAFSGGGSGSNGELFHVDEHPLELQPEAEVGVNDNVEVPRASTTTTDNRNHKDNERDEDDGDDDDDDDAGDDLEEEVEEEEEEGYRFMFSEDMDPLTFTKEDPLGFQPYEQFERLENQYEALAAKKRKARHLNEPSQSSSQAQDSEIPAKKPRPEDVSGATMEEIMEVMNFGMSRRSRKVVTRLLLDQFSNIEKVDYIFFNSFDKLEDEVATWMVERWPIKTVGPTAPLTFVNKKLKANINDRRGNYLFETNTEACLKWLDQRETNSVVYVSFGSVVAPEKDQIEEVAEALLRSNCKFLWVVRDEEESKLPKTFKSQLTSEQVGQLDDEGHNVTFGDGSWKVSKGAMIVAQGQKTGTLYMTSSCRDTLAAVDAGANSSLWHCRLGHMSEKGMKLLLSNGKLPELKSVKHKLCESYILGKQKKVSFSKGGREPKASKLELVHTDVWGPSPVTSLGGSRYYVTFIDDSSRKVWVYFLKNKSDVYETFKRWKVMVENETNLKVKCLRSDNGGEYEDVEFKKYCALNGIKMEKTIPGTPQQNGVAERMNKTLNERARSMRLHAGLPKSFWADAVNTASYLINRGPSVPLGYRIPEEVWSGKEVNLSFLKVFGCLSYVHIDSASRTKLDPKSKKCFFIGYGDNEFGYRFWDDKNRKIIRSRDVIFNEYVMYKDRSSIEAGDECPEIKKTDEVPLMDIPVNESETSNLKNKEIAAQNGDPQTLEIELRRSSRTIRPPQKYSPALHYILLTDKGEPETFEEAMQNDDSIKWELAMKDEMDSLSSNQTWELTELPEGKKALHNKWVYRIKEEVDGSKQYKARLVVKGFQQREDA